MSGPPFGILAAAPRWVAWHTQTRAGRPTKVPYSPHTDRPAKSDDPSTWSDRPAATDCARRTANGAIGGVGIMLGDHYGVSLGGIDLDTCRDPETREIEAWATEVIERFGTYTEVSPSGAGAKLYFRYPAADLSQLRSLMGSAGRAWKRPGNDHPPSIELYLDRRYFAVTDEHLTSTPLELRLVATDTLRWLIEVAGPAFVGADPANPSHDDAGLRARIEAACATSPSLARRWAGDWSGLADTSASGKAMALGAAFKRAGLSLPDMCAALSTHPDIAHWVRTKGDAHGRRELRRIWDRADSGLPDDDAGPDTLTTPDMSITRLSRRRPPTLPLDVFGPQWRHWIEGTATAGACPPDYVVGPLLAAASALIGNARWAQATPGWTEPPHLWCGVVGDSGVGKSPGADCLMRDVLPVIERRMIGDFPDRLAEWRLASEQHAASMEKWKADVRAASKNGCAPPLPPADDFGPEPQAPRLRQSDVTIERVATLLASAAPKGLMVVRDELAGWLLGLNAYHDAGRPFWIEAYGGRPFRVERQKSPQPIEIPRLAVAVCGGTQPDRLAELFRDGDDGLLARFCWWWPDPLPFRLGGTAPAVDWAIDAFDRLRLLDLAPTTDGARPVMVPLDRAALPNLEAFGREMHDRQQQAGGLMRSALGKARGTTVRLALVIEHLWWCGGGGMDAPPAAISHRAFLAAATLVADYLMPMAERVYSDAAATAPERRAATLANWILRTRPLEAHVRQCSARCGCRGCATPRQSDAPV